MRLLASILLLLGGVLESQALTNFFVHTDVASAGGTGKQNDPFKTLREAITSSALDVSDVRVIYVSGRAADTQNITQTHWDSVDTTPSTKIIIIGNNPTPGVYNTNAWRGEVNGTSFFYNNKPGHVEMYNLQIKITNGDNNTHAYRLSTANVGSGRTDCLCIVADSFAWLPDGGNAGYNSTFAQGAPGVAGRMIFYNFVSIGGNMGAADGGVENYNVTLHNAGFVDGQHVENSIVTGFSGTDFNGLGFTGDYNIDDDNSAPGANSITGTPLFVNAGVDMHLSQSDTIAKDAGLADPSGGVFTTDADGRTRTDWSIGAFDNETWLPLASRRIDWGPYVNGVDPDGIPHRTTIAATLSAGATSAQIEAAIDAAAEDTVVYLNAGAYNLTSTAFSFKSNRRVTLRGAGIGQTILTFTGDDSYCITSDQYGVAGATAIVDGAIKGSTNLWLASSPAAGFAVNNIILLRANDDQSIVFAASGPAKRMKTMHRITAVSGTRLTIWPPVIYTLTGLAPEVLYQNGGPGAVMCGLEDMTIDGGGDRDDIVQWWATDRCWITRCRLIKGDNSFAWVLDSLQPTIYMNDFADADGYPNNSDGYGVYLYGSDSGATSFARVENNTFRNMFVSVWLTSSSGNAILYNFVTNGVAQGFTHQLGAMMFSHGPHPMMDLWEGNASEQLSADAIHGGVSHETVFRPWVHGLHPTYSDNRKMIDLTRGAYYFTVAGGVLGHSSWTANAYEMSGEHDYSESVIYRLGYPGGANNGLAFGDGPTWANPAYTVSSYPDTQTAATLIRVNNYDFKTGTIQNPQAIPASLFYTVKPDYFGDIELGFIDPSSPTLDVTDHPAGYRFVNGSEPSGGSGSDNAASVQGTFNARGTFSIR
jgi:hypothetical protein